MLLVQTGARLPFDLDIAPALCSAASRNDVEMLKVLTQCLFSPLQYFPFMQSLTINTSDLSRCSLPFRFIMLLVQT
tara:strand:+ start:563 stop:790 length:228 start_codon:yes stop_codon:yes gene_type:complete